MPRKRCKSTGGAQKESLDYPRVANLKSLLIRNEEENELHSIQVLCKHAEDDHLPIIFGWEKVQEFVVHIPNLPAAAPLPAFPLPVPLSTKNFKQSLLNHIKGLNPSAIVGTTAIPCTQAQAIICGQRAGVLCLHPWFLAVANMGGCTPIAIMYTPGARSNTLDECMSPLLPPAAPLWWQ